MKQKVLFIASNIPTPRKKNNRVLINLAEKMSAFYDIEIIYPKPFVPFGIHFLPKHKHNFRTNPWMEKNISINPIAFIRLPIRNWAFVFFRKLKYKLGNQKPILSHAHFLIPDGIFSYYLYRDHQIPYLLTLRGGDIRFLQKSKKNSPDYQLLNKVLSNAKKVMCLNDFQREVVSDIFGIKTELTFNGIDKDDIVNFEKFKKDKTKIIVCTVGRLIPQKQIQWVINAVLSYNGSENVLLKIFGDGPFKSELLKLCVNSDRIQFYGHVPKERIVKELRSSHIFALPSTKETFGISFIEAAAAGNALLGHVKEGVWKHLKPNEEMIYAENYQHFENSLHHLISERKTVYRMGRKANQRAREFTWIKLTNSIKENYEKYSK